MRSRWMIGLCAALAAAGSAQAETGVTDHEIKIGQTIAYSGNFGRAELASVKMINGRGGMRGRKINLISLDDGYLPPRGPEQTRRLVEQDKVFIVFAPLGTASNVVLGKYLKEKHVPQVFAIIGVASFGDHARYPWTTGWQPTYEIEDQIFTRYILKERPNAKIAILYQNDELGKDYVRGIQRELGDRAKSMIVGMQSYEITDPSVESQVVTRHHSGADTFINVSTPKF
ncbi:MAG: ABC transporter substrate-binding protein, partial [Acetobacteraceae bacterium]|nr:ABC transporter substrate-binding protein [Acetobacteraceae bacterium]